MRILFLGAHFPRPNNTTNGVWALAQVQALRAAGHQIEVISPVPAIPASIFWVIGRGTSALCPAHHRWGEVDAHYVRWPVYPVGPLAKYVRNSPTRFIAAAWFMSARRFLAIARSFAPDVIFAHQGQLGGYVAARLARRLQVPFIITEHSFGEIESCASNPRRRRHYTAATRGIHTWIAVAERMRSAMQDNFPGVPVMTLHNGTNLVPDGLRGVPRPPELAGRIVVLFVGFLYRRKNVPLLIRAFDRVAAANPLATLVVIGDGEAQAAVNAAARGCRNSQQLRVHAAKRHAEVLQYMVWADVFASIGVDEPFATVFSEAMMAGKPIIYATDGGITDVVVSGTHGLGVPPNDLEATAAALGRLLKDASLRRSMGAAARRLASHHLTWTANVEVLGALFAAALHPPAVPATMMLEPVTRGREVSCRADAE